MSDELNDLLRLTKRIGYGCPVEHISGTFYTLYIENRSKALKIDGAEVNEELEMGEAIRDAESILKMRQEVNVPEISPYL